MKRFAHARYFAKGNYSGHGDKKVYRAYYTCYSRGKVKADLIHDPNCKNKSYFTGALDDIVIGEVLKLSYDPAYFDMVASDQSSTSNQERQDISILEIRVSDLDKQIGRLLDLYQMGTMDKDELSSRIRILTNEKQKIMDQLMAFDELIEEPKNKIQPGEAIDLLQSAQTILSGDDQMKKRELVHSLIDRIELVNDDVIIQWAFN